MGRGWWRAQYVVFGLLGGAVAWLLGGVFQPGAVAAWLVAAMLFGGLFVICWRDPFPEHSDKLVQRGVLAALGTAFVLNFHFYPNLLQFQSTSTVPRYALAAGIPAEVGVFQSAWPGNGLLFGAGTPGILHTRGSG